MEGNLGGRARTLEHPQGRAVATSRTSDRLPVGDPHGYRTDTVKVSLSPACVGQPAGLRVAVLVRHQRVAWAPSQRAFLPLIVRRSAAE